MKRQASSWRKSGWFLLLSFVIVTKPSCQEDLPPYRDPSEVFEGHIQGLYVLSAQENAAWIFITVKNTFDETLEAPAVIGGTLRIVSSRYPDYRKTLSLNKSHIINARGYDPTTGVLRIDSGDSIRLGYAWNFIDDNGRDLRTQVFQYWGDTTCRALNRRISYQETFLLSAEVKVFDKIPALSIGMTNFSMCHVNIWVNPKDCPPIIGDQACSYR